MDWMAETAERRADPRILWPEVRSIILLGMNYGPDCDPLEDLDKRDRATISVYARNRDYHDVIKGRLKELAGFLVARAGGDVKVFVDTAPVMEKPLAEAAGLGWQGKHTVLVSREFGSWLFWARFSRPRSCLRMPPERPFAAPAGAASISARPTPFPRPSQLDARRCISYLTIEHKGHIDRDLRPGIGNRIFGCDDCLAVCPWNKFAQAGREAKAAPSARISPGCRWTSFASLDDTASPGALRGGADQAYRARPFPAHVLIAIGNSGMPALAEVAQAATLR